MSLTACLGLPQDGTLRAAQGLPRPTGRDHVPQALGRYVAAVNALGQEFGMGRGWCIAAARLSSVALPQLGFARVRTIGVQLIAAPEEALRLIAAGTPVEQWPPRLWPVGVEGTDSVEGGWDGHAVTVVTETVTGRRRSWLLDPTLDQFSHPGRLSVDPLLAQVDGALLAGETVHRRSGNALVTYRRLPELRGHLHVPQWTDEVLIPKMMDRLLGSLIAACPAVFPSCREQDAAIVRSGRCGPGHSSSSRYLRRAFMA